MAISASAAPDLPLNLHAYPAAEAVVSLQRFRNQLVGNRRRKAACQSLDILNALTQYATTAVRSPDEAEWTAVDMAVDSLGRLAMPTQASVELFMTADVERTLLATLGWTSEPSTSASAAARAALLQTCLRALKAVYTARADLSLRAKSKSVDVRALFDSGSKKKQGHDEMDIDTEHGEERTGEAASSKSATSSCLQDHWQSVQALISLLAQCSGVTTREANQFEQHIFSSDTAKTTLMTDICDLFVSAAEADDNAILDFVLGKNSGNADDEACLLTRAAVRIVIGQTGKLLLSALRLIQALASSNKFGVAMYVSWPDHDGDLGTFLDCLGSMMHSSDPQLCLAASATTECFVTCIPFSKGDVTSAASVIPVLLKVLEQEPDLRVQASLTFAQMVIKVEYAQEIATRYRCFEIMRIALAPVESDLPYKTESVIRQETMLKENIFVALASFCVNNQAWRSLVITANLLPAIVQGLKHPASSVRASACLCIRGLSRSVNILRTSLLDSGAAEAICDLLKPEEEWHVQISACATISNLLLEFSPMRQTLLDLGCMNHLCRIAKVDDMSLRRTALWAIKNAVYQSKSDLKRQVMEQLGWDFFGNLIEEDNEATSEQALGILRNVVSTNDGEPPVGVAELGEERMFAVIQRRLKSKSTKILLHALFTLVNLATADDTTKLSIAQRDPVMREVINSLAHSEAEVRSAAVWVIINLAYQEGKASYKRKQGEVVAVLRTHGIDLKLKRMVADESLDVRERVQDALKALSDGVVY